MRKGTLLLALILGVSCLSAALLLNSVQARATAARQIGSSISGFVFDENRRPLANIYVELLDDVDFPTRRVRTDGSGRYFFGGLKNGKFSIRVKPYELGYREEVKDATIETLSRGSSTTGQQNFGGTVNWILL